MLIEIHMLQNHSPSNLNRDDTGSPKDCIFGGVRRSRISSQSLKRAIRRSPVFREGLGNADLAYRTKKLPDLVRGLLLERGLDRRMADIAAQQASGFGKKEDKASGNEESATPTTPWRWPKRDMANSYPLSMMSLTSIRPSSPSRWLSRRPAREWRPWNPASVIACVISLPNVGCSNVSYPTFNSCLTYPVSIRHQCSTRMTLLRGAFGNRRGRWRGA